MDVKKPSKSKKAFNFRLFKQRYIALKILYFGWDYDGLAEQDNSANTIEHHLFRALETTCLIESRSTCKYNRCGRTDKGVSSYGQVVNLSVRSNLTDEFDPNNEGLFTPSDYDGSVSDSEKQASEIDYVGILNRVLPDHIRVLAWAPVKREFSARFDCKSRSYSYLFPRGNLDLDSMREAIKYMIGEHDFRNLCLFDLKNGVTNHRRTIVDAFIRRVASTGDINHKEEDDSQYSYYEIIIVGKAFLYHQIRCIMSILFLIGVGKENPSIIRYLLDLNECPSKPNYNRACPLPLSLFNCEYEVGCMPRGWIYDQQAIFNVHRHLKKLWFRYRTKAAMIERVLWDLEGSSNFADSTAESKRIDDWRDFGLEFDTMSDKKYTPVLKRPRDETLESKLEALKVKKMTKQSDLN